jgi:antitoxin (DNA-binding transcriptional repressor) of toxin-antitoxin stability system
MLIGIVVARISPVRAKGRLGTTAVDPRLARKRQQWVENGPSASLPLRQTA